MREGDNRPLKVLYLEDDPRAFELVCTMLETEGLDCEILHAEDEPGFRSHLQAGGIDLILADFNLPSMDGLTALELKRELAPDAPFIFVSGSLGEDVAIESLRNGATDFVLKDSLVRLAPAVRRAVGEAREHRERLGIEQALRASEERFRRLAENAPDVIFRVRLHPDLAYEYISPAVEKITGYKPQEFYADPRLGAKITHPDDRPLVQSLAEQRSLPEGIRLVRWIARDGRIVRVEQRFVSIRDEHGRVVGIEGIARDITERVKAEEQIRILSLAVEQSPVAVDISDGEGRIVFVNARQCELAGRSREELLGSDPRALHSPRNPPGVTEDIDRTVQRGRTWNGELMQLNSAGEDVLLRAAITPIRDASGAAIYYLGVKEDITQWKREQESKRRLEAQLFQAQKLESIGTLAGGIAHDFNNILTGILGFAELANLGLPEDHPTQEEIGEILAAGNRAKDLVAQILTFSRQKDFSQAPVDLSRVVGEALKLVRASTPSTIEIERDLHHGIVRADPVQVHQVVLNLCTNAVHAMQDRSGTLTVNVRHIAVDGALAAQIPGLAVGDYLSLSVSDTGHGIDEATLQRIFDPFFTTKRAGEGTGLGLSLVQGIVAAHHGAIRVRSAPGKGTTFEIFFPVSREAERADADATPIPRGNGQRLMVVDDETSVTTYLAVRLQQLGYRCEAFADVRDAEEAFARAPDQYDALFTDLTMPHFTGLELIRRVRALRPGLPCILASGYSDKLSERDLAAAGGVVSVAKPFSGDTLGRALHPLLNPVAPI